MMMTVMTKIMNLNREVGLDIVQTTLIHSILMEYDIFHIANIDADCDKANKINETIAIKYRDTPLESSVSDIVKNILKMPQEFLTFYDNQYQTADSLNIGRGTSKDINDFYLSFNRHVSSESYTSSVENLRQTQNSQGLVEAKIGSWPDMLFQK